VATVIDSLVVLLGLDASNYKKGRETAEKETKETARVTRQSADAITKSLTEVGRTVAALFLGFESVSGFTKFLGELNQGEADLGRTAATLGITAHELNKYGLAARYAGQDAGSVAASFKTLTDAAVKFQSGQGTSPILDLMRQVGVNVFDTNGKLRNQGEIYEELARKTAGWGTAIRSARFAAAGIAQGEINYLIQSQKQREDQLRLAEKNNSVDADSVAKAQMLQEYWRNIGVQIESAGQKILSTLTPAVQGVFDVVSKIFAQFKDTGGLDRVGQIFQAIWAVVKLIGNSITAWADLINGSVIGKYFNFMFKLYGKGLDLLAPPGAKTAPSSGGGGPPVPTVAPPTGYQPPPTGYQPPPGSKAARFNNPGNILDKQGNERRYASPAEGQAALERDLAAKWRRGLRTVDAIITAYEGGDTVHNNIPAYIADVRKRLGKNELTPDDIKALAQAIAIHESGPTPGLVGKAAGGAATGGNRSTTVTVGTIQVNAPNADPRAVADHIAGAIQRKQDVSQAMQGQS
jgi:hypothetical protein